MSKPDSENMRRDGEAEAIEAEVVTLEKIASTSDLNALLAQGEVDPVDSSTVQALCTLVVTDLVDSGKLLSELGDRRSAQLNARHDQIARDLLARHGGREIDKSDGFLILFLRSIEAVSFVLDYHKALAQLSATENVDLRTRAGIHLGEIYLRRNPPEEIEKGAKPVEVEGLAKVVAARLMSLAQGGQTLMTRGAFDIAQRAADDVADTAGLTWVSHASYRLKGIDEPVEICEVGIEGTTPLLAPPDSEKAVRADLDSTYFGRARRRPVMLIPALLLLAILLFGIWSIASRPQTPPPIRTVAVLAPQVQASTESEDTAMLAYAVRNALIRALTSIEGLSPKSASEVDTISGPPTAVARAVGADDVLESTITCRARDCSVELRRVRGSDGGIELSYGQQVPLDNLLIVAKAVGAGLRQVFPEARPRPGHGAPEASPEDYTTYVEIRRSFDARPEMEAMRPLLDRLEGLRQRSPRFVEAFILEAEIAFFIYDQTREEALLARSFDLVEQGQSVAPGDTAILFSRAYIEINAGRLDEATASLAKLGHQVPGDARILDMRARISTQRGDLAQALDFAARAREQRPSWDRLFRHANLAKKLGKLTLARESLEQLLKLSPGNISGVSLYAQLEMMSGDPQRAADLYTDLIARSPTPGRLSNLGLTQMLLQDYAASASALEKAVEQAPSNPALLLNLADAYWLVGRAREAEDLYRRTKNLIPEDSTNPMELARLAQARAQLAEPREAVEAILAAVQLAPENNDVAFMAALVSTVVGDHNTAMAYAKKALDLGYAPRWFQLPWFNDLRTHHAFREMIAAATEGR